MTFPVLTTPTIATHIDTSSTAAPRPPATYWGGFQALDFHDQREEDAKFLSW